MWKHSDANQPASAWPECQISLRVAWLGRIWISLNEWSVVHREPLTYDYFLVEFGYGPIYPFPASADRASVAAEIANLPQGARSGLQPSVDLQDVSRARAAEMLNVSERSVDALAQRIGELSKALDTGKPDRCLEIVGSAEK